MVGLHTHTAFSSTFATWRLVAFALCQFPLCPTASAALLPHSAARGQHSHATATCISHCKLGITHAALSAIVKHCAEWLGTHGPYTQCSNHMMSAPALCLAETGSTTKCSTLHLSNPAALRSVCSAAIASEMAKPLLRPQLRLQQRPLQPAARRRWQLPQLQHMRTAAFSTRPTCAVQSAQ